MFLINLQGKESIYEQIKTQIIRFIQLGVLKSGDKLPTVRGLADELGINPNTVMKAYQELEEHGYIYMLSKKGAFVSGETYREKEHNIRIYSAIQAILDDGYSFEEIRQILKELEKGGYNA